MSSEQKFYGTGDWIVHVFYGLGQVLGIDNKMLDGEIQSFLKVKTSDSVYWIPTTNIDITRIRPLASQRQFRYALSLIEKSPKQLPKDYLQRRRKISKTLHNISLYSKVRMIRDLHGRRITTKYDSTDNNVLKNLKEQFLNEWTMVMNENRKNLESKLNKALVVSIEKVSVGEQSDG